MYENILHQSAPTFLSRDIAQSTFPRAVLFSGPSASGKLTCALETARVLSCTQGGDQDCSCPSCERYKLLISENILLCGSGTRVLEVAAAKKTLLSQVANDTPYIADSRLLFTKAARKITLKFTPTLWEGEDKYSKTAVPLQTIEESLAQIEGMRDFHDTARVEKLLDETEKACDKLEDEYLYSSLPVQQVRNISNWAAFKSDSGAKVVIIENAHMMQESAKNALLKTLEEPPPDVFFILTTTKRGAILPTILSRVRDYRFAPLTAEQQQDVLDRVFHCTGVGNSINDHLLSFLKVKPDEAKRAGELFAKEALAGQLPDAQKAMKCCGGFSPKILFSLFAQGAMQACGSHSRSALAAESSFLVLHEIKRALTAVETYNQTPLAALESLSVALLKVTKSTGALGGRA